MKFLLPTLAFILVFCNSLGQNNTYKPVILKLINEREMVDSPRGMSLRNKGWSFKAGDDLEWAKPNLEDTDWRKIPDSFFYSDSLKGWKGVGWFRLQFRIDTSLVGKVVSFHHGMGFNGAIEIYLDGKKVYQAGRVGKDIITEKAMVILLI